MDVGGWLRKLGLEQYAAAFRENKIDDTVLPSLTAEDLKDLGVEFVGDRRKLLNAIAALNVEASAPWGTFSTSPPRLASTIPLPVLCGHCNKSAPRGRVSVGSTRDSVKSVGPRCSKLPTGSKSSACPSTQNSLPKTVLIFGSFLT